MSFTRTSTVGRCALGVTIVLAFFVHSGCSKDSNNNPGTPTTTAALASVSLNPTSVVAGASVQGTVTLNAAAPTGNAVVTLTSSNTSAATVPANVTVNA